MTEDVMKKLADRISKKCDDDGHAWAEHSGSHVRDYCQRCGVFKSDPWTRKSTALADAGQAHDAHVARMNAERVADKYREILKGCALLLDAVQPHLDLAAYAEQVQEAGESLRLVTAQRRADRARELVKLIGELK